MDISSYLRTSPLFFLPGVLDVCLNLHWCSQFFPEGINSFTSSTCSGVVGSVVWAALQVDTACCNRALMCFMYGKTASFCLVTCC